MKEICKRWEECDAFKKIGCINCGFQHFEKILETYPDNKYLKFLVEKFFELCSARRKGIGGRISLDTPIKELFKKEIPELKELSPQAMKVKLTIGEEIVDFGIKCDGAFQIGGRYIFYEVMIY